MVAAPPSLNKLELVLKRVAYCPSTNMIYLLDVSGDDDCGFAMDLEGADFSLNLDHACRLFRVLRNTAAEHFDFDFCGDLYSDGMGYYIICVDKTRRAEE